MSEIDPYRELGIEPGASPAETRAAFRAALLRSHPDTAVHGTDPGDVRRVIEAYRMLAGDVPSPTPGESPAERAPRSGSFGICRECRGNGVVREPTPCPACRGTGGFTDLTGRRGRIIRCARCGGAGRVTGSQCTACGGSGRTPRPRP